MKQDGAGEETGGGGGVVAQIPRVSRAPCGTLLRMEDSDTSPPHLHPKHGTFPGGCREGWGDNAW